MYIHSIQFSLFQLSEYLNILCSTINELLTTTCCPEACFLRTGRLSGIDTMIKHNIIRAKIYINEYFSIVAKVNAVQLIDTLVSKNLNKADLKMHVFIRFNSCGNAFHLTTPRYITLLLKHSLFRYTKILS